jgi:tetratricopeptide (TPR) repeat protein/predicted Ser/Thr protein kinase
MDSRIAARLSDTVREDLARRLAERCAARGFPEPDRLTPAQRDELLDEILRPPAGPALPSRLGRYELQGELGKGGLGTVHRAYDARLRRTVALKTLRAGDASAHALVREAQAAARLSHPNIVTVYDAGEIDGIPFISMELVEGTPLGALFAAGRPIRDLVAILRKVAGALAYAHAQGVVHRDLKPGNVLVDARGEPHVIDFGLARTADSLGQTVGPVGTPSFMSPEHIRDPRSVGPRSDVYSLGVCLYQAMTGRLPFEGTDLYPVFQQILREEPAPPGGLREGATRDLESVCLKALEKDPERRYAGAAEMEEDLDRALRGEPVRARPPSAARRLGRALSRSRGFLVLGALIVAAAGFAAWSVRTAGRVRLHERLGPLEAFVAETRPLFYVRSADLSPRLARLEGMLGALEAEPEAARAVGEGWALAGDLERAERFLRRAKAPFPLGRLLLRRSLMTLVTEDGSTPSERLARARSLHEEAVSLLRREISGGEMDRHLALALRAFAEGNSAEAARLCREGLEKFGDSMGTEEYLILLGAMTPDPRDRLEPLTQAIERRPHDPFALHLRAGARRELGDLAGAIEDFSRALAANPRLAGAFNDRGVTRTARGEHDLAIADFDRAIAADPRMTYAVLNRALPRAAKGDLDGAIADCDRGIALDGRRPTAFVNRGTFRQSKGDLVGALQDFERALALDARHAPAYVARGGLRWARQDAVAALADYTRAIELDPRYAEARAGRGTVRVLSGDSAGALEDFDQAVRLDPGHAMAFYYRGTLHAERGDGEKAMADLDAAIRLRPHFAAAYATRGILFEDLDDFDRAMRDYETAIRIDPRYPDAYLNRAIALLERDRAKEALADLDRALEHARPDWNSRAMAERLREEARRKLGQE